MHQVFFRLGHRATRIRRGRRARETHADAPVIACRYEDKGKQPAYEWFGVGSETLLNPAAVGGCQKDARPIWPMSQLPFLGAFAHWLEPRLGSNLGIVCQIQRLDAMLLFVRDHHLQPATIAAALTISVLHQRQIS